MRTQRMLLSPEAGENGGADDKPSKPADAGKPDDTLATLVRKNAELERDNHDFRRKNKSLREELATARDSRSIPAEVESELTAYRALGKPEEIKGGLEKVSAFEREKRLAQIAAKAGVSNVPAFAKVAGSAEFEVRKEKVDGKEVEAVFVKDGDAEPVPFDQHFADFLPAIKPDAKKEAASQGTPRRGSAYTPPEGAAHTQAVAPQRQPLTRF